MQTNPPIRTRVRQETVLARVPTDDVAGVCAAEWAVFLNRVGAVVAPHLDGLVGGGGELR